MTHDDHDHARVFSDLGGLEDDLRIALGSGLDRRSLLRWLALAGGSGAAFAAGLHAVLRGDPLLAGVPRRTLAWAADRCAATGSDTEGPFYLGGAPRRAVLNGPDEPGDRLSIRGRVLSSDCRTPLRGAVVDVWQADAEGRYHDAGDGFRLRGRILADDAGRYELATVVPGRYRIAEASSYRPAHIHFKVSAPDARAVTTQLYFKGDPYLAPHDACGGECHSDDPGRVIELRRTGSRHGGFAGTFDVVLAAASA